MLVSLKLPHWAQKYRNACVLQTDTNPFSIKLNRKPTTFTIIFEQSSLSYISLEIRKSAPFQFSSLSRFTLLTAFSLVSLYANGLVILCVILSRNTTRIYFVLLQEHCNRFPAKRNDSRTDIHKCLDNAWQPNCLYILLI